MNNVLKLRKPLLVNGVELTEIPYDFEKLGVEDIIEADKHRQDDTGVPSIIPTIDRATQFELFARAVEKVRPDIDRADLKRMGYKDAVAAMVLVRDFTNAGDDDPEAEEPEESAKGVVLPLNAGSVAGAGKTSRKQSGNSDT